jgi:hypothetical protein
MTVFDDIQESINKAVSNLPEQDREVAKAIAVRIAKMAFKWAQDEDEIPDADKAHLESQLASMSAVARTLAWYAVLEGITTWIKRGLKGLL